MQVASTIGGSNFRQTPRHDEARRQRETRPPKEPAALLNAEQSAALLGVGVRKFQQMRELPWMPQPVTLGERSLRWVRAELLEAITMRSPRGGQDQPAHLARAKG